MQKLLELDLEFLEVCLEQDKDFDEDQFIEKFCESDIRDKMDKQESPIVTFKNLKLLKSFIQQKGTSQEKEAILKMIKKFKSGEYDA